MRTAFLAQLGALPGHVGPDNESHGGLPPGPVGGASAVPEDLRRRPGLAAGAAGGGGPEPEPAGVATASVDHAGRMAPSPRSAGEGAGGSRYALLPPSPVAVDQATLQALIDAWEVCAEVLEADDADQHPQYDLRCAALERMTREIGVYWASGYVLCNRCGARTLPEVKARWERGRCLSCREGLG